MSLYLNIFCNVIQFFINKFNAAIYFTHAVPHCRRITIETYTAARSADPILVFGESQTFGPFTLLIAHPY